ncbi:MAG TPA: beta-propeller fold lactonase family protein [Candidatus Methylomirabilis sp.]|nr:beta-propeller fold lactonase family protein [Candidatus Methylomirabilis sp.]
MKRVSLLLMLGLMALVASACGTSSQPSARRPAPVGEGRLIVTLNGPERSPIDLTAELTGLMLHARGGGWFQIPVSPLTINSLEMVRRQIPLADVPVPAGHYDQLTLKFGKASSRQEGRVASLSVPPEGFTFNVPVEVEPGAIAPLFLTWDVDRSVANEVFLAAAFSFQGKEPELRGVVAYVTNEESGTLSVVDRAKGQVVSTIQVGRAPRGIVVEPDTRRAFVLNGGSDSITIIDVNTHRAVFTFNLEVRARAQELAVSPQGQALYVANTALNSLSVLDTASFGVAATVPVGISPVSVAVDPRGNRVLVANQGSNNVSVIDSFANRVVATVSVEPGPVHVAVDANPGADRAFVASPMSAFMSVVAPSTGQVLRRLSVGPGAVATIPDVIANRLFVVKAAQNRVAVFDTSLNVEIGGFAVGRSPHRIALDPDRDKLYVVNRGGDSVTVADRLSRRGEGTIPVGKRPFAVALIR